MPKLAVGSGLLGLVKILSVALIFGVASQEQVVAAQAGGCQGEVLGCYNDFQCEFGEGMSCMTAAGCRGVFYCVIDESCGEDRQAGLCWVQPE